MIKMSGFFLIATVISLVLGILNAAYAGQAISYKDGKETMSGYWAHSECRGMPRATVLIVHQWKGLGQSEQERADMLARACYNAFAVDVYGEAVRPKTDEDAAKESAKYKTNPELARHRMKVALEVAKEQPDVYDGRIAVMGYCFGGYMALEMARAGENVAAAISFHGSLATQEKAKPGAIKAKVLVHHGDADPYVKTPEVDEFQEEMRAAKVDWQLVRYANAVHAFTDKHVGSDPSKGVAYNEKADRRSWGYTLDFLDQTF